MINDRVTSKPPGSHDRQDKDLLHPRNEENRLHGAQDITSYYHSALTTHSTEVLKLPVKGFCTPVFTTFPIIS